MSKSNLDAKVFTDEQRQLVKDYRSCGFTDGEIEGILLSLNEILDFPKKYRNLALTLCSKISKDNCREVNHNTVCDEVTALMIIETEFTLEQKSLATSLLYKSYDAVASMECVRAYDDLLLEVYDPYRDQIAELIRIFDHDYRKVLREIAAKVSLSRECGACQDLLNLWKLHIPEDMANMPNAFLFDQLGVYNFLRREEEAQADLLLGSLPTEVATKYNISVD